MPYLREIQKKKLDHIVSRLSMSVFTDPGELNYLFTELIKRYLDNNAECYSTYNNIIGALECCKLELYRRKIARYEDFKIKENGDVYL